MARTRVLVVDDSVVVRRLVTEVLSRDPRIDVVGVAANGRIALAKIEQLAPDLVTMDVEMPELDGIGAVRAMRAAGHRQPVIMFSTLTERGAEATLDALQAGATDYVTKPGSTASMAAALAEVAAQLVPRILALAPPRGGEEVRAPVRPLRAVTAPAVPVTRPAPVPVLRPAAPHHRVRLVAVGASTGGPEALSRLVGALPVLPVPVVVVQHMPPVFTRQLAQRLDRLGPVRVHEAEQGQVLEPGHAYVAPGDRHLVVRYAAGELVAHLDDGPPVNYCRPAVDVLLRSAVDAVRGELLAVVLTGMGADGRAGAESVVHAGGTVVVQDEPTSVVWGMPGAVATAGWAHAVLPLGEIADAVTSTVTQARRAPVGRIS
ncbi:chemotaxis-specific protein-glutamate methyltransferase CheB [Cellulomonas sp. JZ18]|uniref:chemotaxis-specific protein-glutamate methyltransferase CheB n=1 Tax=Cellulomonas sp. JZ18 TaxID=2654191 RepID=UPI0012D48CF0|nr:chemotaxis-specific protein-glutamate methyltransferase CheB [Cellulomonas sp. JZ18]QGQ20287.1 chemotaxis-specific protein-glutamate methyltransferase CheB [Cellulomonas sp. JZ18]